MAEPRKQTDVTMPAEEAEAHIAEVLARVEAEGEAVVLERGGEPRAVIVPIEEFRRLREARERERRAEIFREMEKARLAVAASVAHLSDEEIEQIANELRHEVHQALIEKGHVRFIDPTAPQ